MGERSSIRRYGSLLLATAVTVLTLAVVAKASQTITVPNAVTYSYSLASGANSSPITPVTNQSVLMIGSQTSPGYRGVAMGTLLHVPSSFIEWVGLESTSGAAITQGFSASPGTHILYLDFAHLVDVQVASADTIRIHNANSITQTGDLKLIW
jgi:hypothetical protein